MTWWEDKPLEGKSILVLENAPGECSDCRLQRLESEFSDDGPGRREVRPEISRGGIKSRICGYIESTPRQCSNHIGGNLSVKSL